eukprot:scaffold67296_cov48-Phaeocystis_antarctica.AAC.1
MKLPHSTLLRECVAAVKTLLGGAHRGPDACPDVRKGRVTCGPGATTTLEPAFAFKRAVLCMTRRWTNTGRLACRRVVCDTCVLKPTSPAALGAADTGCTAQECSGARGELLGRPSRETPVGPSKEALRRARSPWAGAAGGDGQAGGGEAAVRGGAAG